MSNRLEVLKNSLAKKESLLENKLSNHFADVASANGQPLNDKRNGQATLNRWERQIESIRNANKEIEKTKAAIEKEEYKLAACAEVKELLPECILNLMENGTLVQWRKHPKYFFVKGVERARIVWNGKTITPLYHTEIPNQEQYNIYRDVFNPLSKALLNT